MTCVAVFRDGHFRLAVAHRFEGYNLTYILWQIWGQAHLVRVDPFAVFAGKI